ncbi:uncharacterized protein Cep164 isoform X2 [Drosophila pseudoobscura]|uniref:Uncharacterized protein Cep164 isoform X2 n=1 Tax=Drosophila pseudoobscura pseudoobscura TaxID=46245 RepID=A0A6I8W345_DROPS|nr:uncharacterized protein LOC6899416 isoform X2 [Drosophila pseudoobscura]
MTTTSNNTSISSATPLMVKTTVTTLHTNRKTESAMTIAASKTKRSGYISPSTSVICEEVFDDACLPSSDGTPQRQGQCSSACDSAVVIIKRGF